jgi:hypothetical protein
MSEINPPMDGEARHIAVVEQGLPEAVKDSWVTATLHGIRKFPQTNREGSTVTLAQAVLKDPPKSWHSFFDSHITSTQVESVGRRINGIHKQYDVKDTFVPADDRADKKPLVRRVVSHVKREGRHDITPDRVKGLWQGATEEVGRAFLGYIRGEYYLSQYVLRPNDIKEIARFFDEDASVERAAALKQTIDIAAEAMGDEQGTKISNNYKAEVVANTPTQGRWLHEIRQHVTDRVSEQIPESNMEWLYGK